MRSNVPRSWVDEWFGYGRHDKLITLGMVAVVVTLPITVPAFAGFILVRGCYRKVLGIGE